MEGVDALSRRRPARPRPGADAAYPAPMTLADTATAAHEPRAPPRRRPRTSAPAAGTRRAVDGRRPRPGAQAVCAVVGPGRRPGAGHCPAHGQGRRAARARRRPRRRAPTGSSPPTPDDVARGEARRPGRRACSTGCGWTRRGSPRSPTPCATSPPCRTRSARWFAARRCRTACGCARCGCRWASSAWSTRRAPTSPSTPPVLALKSGNAAVLRGGSAAEATQHRPGRGDPRRARARAGCRRTPSPRSTRGAARASST